MDASKKRDPSPASPGPADKEVARVQEIDKLYALFLEAMKDLERQQSQVLAGFRNELEKRKMAIILKKINHS